jgi:predicted ArsR family transcriptional regulator
MGLRSWWRGRQQGAEDPFVEQIRRAFPDADVTVAHQTVELVGDGEEADDLRAALEAAGFATVHETGEADEGNDPATQLERLAALHRQGVLTDAEFSAAKGRVIGG